MGRAGRKGERKTTGGAWRLRLPSGRRLAGPGCMLMWQTPAHVLCVRVAARVRSLFSRARAVPLQSGRERLCAAYARLRSARLSRARPRRAERESAGRKGKGPRRLVLFSAFRPRPMLARLRRTKPRRVRAALAGVWVDQAQTRRHARRVVWLVFERVCKKFSPAVVTTVSLPSHTHLTACVSGPVRGSQGENLDVLYYW